MLHLGLKSRTARASRPPAAAAAGARGIAKGWEELTRWSNLAAAALCCLWDARGLRSKWVLVDYVFRNLMRRAGFRLGLSKEIALLLGEIELTFRPLQGELYLYKEIFVDHVYERHPAFRLRRGWCVVDVGANIGVFTLKAACRHGAARTYAFEPHPATFACLRSNLQRNRADNVTAWCKAVGRASGVARLGVASASTIARLDGLAGSLASNELAVEVVTLAAVIRREQIPVIHLLKLDVEGAEADVLRGAEPVLDRIERIVMEYHSGDSFKECTRLLEGHHFRKVLEAPPAYAYFLKDNVRR